MIHLFLATILVLMNSKLILVLLFIHIPKINVKNGQQRQFSDRGDLARYSTYFSVEYLILVVTSNYQNQKIAVTYEGLQSDNLGFNKYKALVSSRGGGNEK